MARTKAKKKEEIEPLPILSNDGRGKLFSLYDQWYGCMRCELGNTRPGQDLVFAEGNPQAKVMIVGEAPGQEEENTGIPFVGASGQLLNQMLALVSDDPHIQEVSAWYDKTRHTKDVMAKFHEEVRAWREKEFFITNVVCCRPPENRQPSHVEVKACFPRLRQMIYEVDPLIIIAVGKTALESLVKKVVEITQKRGQLYEVEIDGRLGKVKYPVMPILHPSFLLRKADWKDKTGDYAKTVKDLHKAMRLKDELMLHNFGTPIPHRVEP